MKSQEEFHDEDDTDDGIDIVLSAYDIAMAQYEDQYARHTAWVQDRYVIASERTSLAQMVTAGLMPADDAARQGVLLTQRWEALFATPVEFPTLPAFEQELMRPAHQA